MAAAAGLERRHQDLVGGEGGGDLGRGAGDGDAVAGRGGGADERVRVARVPDHQHPAVVGGVAGAADEGRTLRWDSVVVDARLDADGRTVGIEDLTVDFHVGDDVTVTTSRDPIAGADPVSGEVLGRRLDGSRFPQEVRRNRVPRSTRTECPVAIRKASRSPAAVSIPPRDGGRSSLPVSRTWSSRPASLPSSALISLSTMDRNMKSPAEQQASGNWKQFKGKLKEAWGSLTDDELDRLEGRRDQLEGMIEERTGETRADIQRRLDTMSRDHGYRW